MIYFCWYWTILAVMYSEIVHPKNALTSLSDYFVGVILVIDLVQKKQVPIFF